MSIKKPSQNLTGRTARIDFTTGTSYDKIRIGENLGLLGERPPALVITGDRTNRCNRILDVENPLTGDTLTLGEGWLKLTPLEKPAPLVERNKGLRRFNPFG